MGVEAFCYKIGAIDINWACVKMNMTSKGSVKLYPEGKIDIHQRKAKYEIALKKFEADDSIIHKNKELILEFLRDCQLGKTILGKSKKKIGVARCFKYLGILKPLSFWLAKPFNEINQKDLEDFIQALESDKIVKKSGQPFSDATKVDIKKAIKKFWKWKDGGNKQYPELVEWIDTYDAVKEIPALTRHEIDNMIEYANNPRDKAIVIVLFDSGARVEELLNVRLKKEHLFWKEDLKCYMVRLEYSKTKPRTISLPLSTNALNRWLEVHPGKNDPLSQLFPLSYPALKMVVNRLGLKALNKRTTPHILRHSSATFYANRLKSPYKLCYRYGWTMASKEVNRYLDREGILEEETAISVKSDEVAVYNRENLKLREDLTFEREKNSELQDKFEELKGELELLKSGKGILMLLSPLFQQQEQMARILERISGEKFDLVMPMPNGSGDEEIRTIEKIATLRAED